MNDADRDALAGEYVLGTLSPAERRAVERQLEDDAAFRAAVRRWQEQLLPLALMVEPADPPAAVWSAIDRTLDGITAKRRRRLLPWLLGLWENLALWRGVGLLGSAAAAALALFIVTRPPPDPATVLVAVLTTSEGAPGWLVEADAAGRLIVEPAAAPATDQRVPELWALPPDGAAPVSLGVLDPRARSRRPLGDDALRALRTATALAVSLEPPGGSPTGAPTGPVVQTGALLRRSR